MLILHSPAVEDRPRDLARVPLQEMRLVASAVDELEGLEIGKQNLHHEGFNGECVN